MVRTQTIEEKIIHELGGAIWLDNIEIMFCKKRPELIGGLIKTRWKREAFLYKLEKEFAEKSFSALVDFNREVADKTREMRQDNLKGAMVLHGIQIARTKKELTNEAYKWDYALTIDYGNLLVFDFPYNWLHRNYHVKMRE